MLYVFRLWLRDIARQAQKPTRSRRSHRPARRASGPLALESLEPLIMPVLGTGYGQLPMAFASRSTVALPSTSTSNKTQRLGLVLNRSV